MNKYNLIIFAQLNRQIYNKTPPTEDKEYVNCSIFM